MSQDELRIGIVGAGQITPDAASSRFRAVADAKVIGRLQPHRESAARVAREFDIPKVYGNWEELISDRRSTPW